MRDGTICIALDKAKCSCSTPLLHNGIAFGDLGHFLNIPSRGGLLKLHSKHWPNAIFLAAGDDKEARRVDGADQS